MNKELSEIYEINEDYKKKIIMYKNKIKELSEIKENIDNDMDINYRRKIQEIEPNKENDIKRNKNQNEIDNNEEKLYFLEKQKEYILSLLLKVNWFKFRNFENGKTKRNNCKKNKRKS